MKPVIRNCREWGGAFKMEERREYLNAHHFKPDVESLTRSSERSKASAYLNLGKQRIC